MAFAEDKQKAFTAKDAEEAQGKAKAGLGSGSRIVSNRRGRKGWSLTILSKHTVYLSLGSNLGDRTANLEAAMERLARLGEVVGRSSFYETEPVEVAGAQPWYLNCVLAVRTGLDPERLLAEILALEQSMGRRRTQPKGPRTIDIDIVLFGELEVQTPELTIPHPGLRQRRFVLEPLAEIAPQAVDPASGKTASELLAELPAMGGVVRRLAAN